MDSQSTHLEFCPKAGKDNLCCPECFHPIVASADPSRCDHCGRSFRKLGGILDFSPGNDFYWGEISQEKMRLINAQASATGNWLEAAAGQLADELDFLRYFMDASRLGWFFHGYQPGHHQVCVDIGSGFGSLSFILSRFFDQVYSIDGVLDRLEFQAIRAAQEHISNVHLIRSLLSKLPFQDASVDLVVANGVLEWIGLSDFSKKPDELQSIFLQEICRVLKPDGILYLGIENRLGARSFLGAKDHSGLPFTNLLPRSWASRLVKFFHHRDQINHRDHKESQFHFAGREAGYRTYTYSIWGYEKMLHQAGFLHIDPAWSRPNYSFPRFSGPLDGDSIRYYLKFHSDHVENKWVRFVTWPLLFLPSRVIKIVHKVFAPEFLFIASRTSLANTLPHRLYEKYPGMQSFTRTTAGAGAALDTTFHILAERGKLLKAVRFAEQVDARSGRSILASQDGDGDEGRTVLTQ